MMQYPQAEQELREALEVFETCLETPIVPGEFGAWSRYIQESWPAVSEQVQHQVHNSHRQQLAEIARQDTEMFARIKQIKAEDVGICQELEELAGYVNRLAEQAPHLERTPAAKQDSVAEDLIRRGLSFITRVKTQEVGVRTWLSEAFNRERGSGD
jgi:hypothetical protein